MGFKEIIAELEKHKDTEEYNNYIGGLQQVTPDRVAKYLETDEGKKFIQPMMDGYFTKGLTTFKEKTMPSIIEEEIKKRNPQADPKDLELQKLQAQIDSIQKEATRKDLTLKATKLATERKLPVSIIDYFIGDTEEITVSNLEKFEKVFNERLSVAVENQLKSNNHVPPAEGGKGKTDPFLEGLGL